MAPSPKNVPSRSCLILTSPEILKDWKGRGRHCWKDCDQGRIVERQTSLKASRHLPGSSRPKTGVLGLTQTLTQKMQIRVVEKKQFSKLVSKKALPQWFLIISAVNSTIIEISFGYHLPVGIHFSFALIGDIFCQIMNKVANDKKYSTFI